MSEEKTLEQLGQEFADVFASTWNERDGQAYGEAYWPDAELVDPTGTIWTGRDQISAMHVGLWQGPARATQVTANVRRKKLWLQLWRSSTSTYSSSAFRRLRQERAATKEAPSEHG